MATQQEENAANAGGAQSLPRVEGESYRACPVTRDAVTAGFGTPAAVLFTNRDIPGAEERPLSRLRPRRVAASRSPRSPLPFHRVEPYTMVPILPQDYAFAAPPGISESSLFEFGRRPLPAAPDLTAHDPLVDATMRLVDGRDSNPVRPAEKAWVDIIQRILFEEGATACSAYTRRHEAAKYSWEKLVDKARECRGDFDPLSNVLFANLRHQNMLGLARDVVHIHAYSKDMAAHLTIQQGCAKTDDYAVSGPRIPDARQGNPSPERDPQDVVHVDPGDNLDADANGIYDITDADSGSGMNTSTDADTRGDDPEEAAAAPDAEDNGPTDAPPKEDKPANAAKAVTELAPDAEEDV
ncbi:hypothetical protein CSUB01_12426 [Colletotrichum sublineola]|uniref:Uncharacterized protein n=1 Tax=Colletotrichum sublineola TaxID=1173701 RepID=A0A066WYK0_COLSU|nr:hypothetical protein CSUB01_12426 [Colletotrichum sublineola]